MPNINSFQFLISKNNTIVKKVFIVILLLSFVKLNAAIWSVGPTQSYNNPSEVVSLVNVGDTVEIDAGVYLGDFCIWNTDELYIKGVGGFAHLDATGVNIPNSKAIWVINGDDFVIEHIEFSGAAVFDKNGAGIRMQGTNLTIRHCYFHDNENGILAGDNQFSDILIEHSQFGNNGYGDGLSHNMYINHINSFTLQYSYSHHAIVGHTVKSRAHNNYILYNRIMDENDGNSSFLVDIPNGGTSFIIGNLIHQGEYATNGNVISYGNEGLSNPNSELYVINNTMVNNRNFCYDFLKINNNSNFVKVFNNLFIDSTCDITNYTGVIDTQTNILTNNSGVSNLSTYDYNLISSSVAINAGSDPDSVGNFSLKPQFEYLHTANSVQRLFSGSAMDVGAYEYISSSGVSNTIAILNNKKLLKIVDILGKETLYKSNTPLFYIYDDGTVEKQLTLE
jgi:hypothetical protein